MKLLILLIITLLTHNVFAEESCNREWEWINPQPNNDSFLDAVWSEGQQQWVAVGYEGAIQTSSDGVIWQIQNSGVPETLYAISSSGSQMIAVGSGTILTSDNGQNWQFHHLFGHDLLDVAWNGSYWVAVGDNGAILTSADGTNWIEQDSGISNKIRTIAWNGHKWIAGSKDQIVSSEDGIHWSLQNLGLVENLFSPPSTFIENWIVDIEWNGEYWLGIYLSGQIITSQDGVNWTLSISRMFVGPFNYFYNADISWNGSYWLAVGGRSGSDVTIIYKSTNGVDWHEIDSVISPYMDLNAVSWNGQQWVMIGMYGKKIVSTDGVNWHWQGQNTLDEISGLHDVAWVNNQWIAVGGSGILTSTDGRQWQKQLVPTERELYAMSWNDNQMVVIGGGTVLTSSDGNHWQLQDSGSFWWWEDVAWNGSYWLVVGFHGTMLRSVDGYSWERYIGYEESFINNLKGVAWNGQQTISVGDHGTVISSTDGINWQLQQSSTVNDLKKIIWYKNRWIAIGKRGTIISSADGVNWQTHNSGTQDTLYDFIETDNPLLVQGSDGLLLSSTDGMNWELVTSNNEYYLGVHHLGFPISLDMATNGSQWVAVGGITILTRSSDNCIITVPDGNTTSSSSGLQEISTRGYVDSTNGRFLYGGFRVTGSGNARVFITVMGPSMSAFGIEDRLENPIIEVYNQADTSAPIAINDDWGTGSSASAIQNQGRAPTELAEPGLILDLPEGQYSVIVKSNNTVSNELQSGEAIVIVQDISNSTSAETGRLQEISTRGYVDSTNGRFMYGGFRVSGSGTASVFITVMGPSMSAFDIEDRLESPIIEVYNQADTSAPIATNDDWGNGNFASTIQNQGRAPTEQAEPGLILELPEGQYSVIVRSNSTVSNELQSGEAIIIVQDAGG